MRSICFFAAYFPGSDIPYYLTVYLAELKKQFTEVVLLVSDKELSEKAKFFLEQNTIRFQNERNEGYDFGLWYKALQKTNVETYDQLALVNDSCILFQPLNEFMSWSKRNGADLQGFTYSEAIAPHIQSFFLIINKRIIPEVIGYFQTHGIIKDIKEVIRTYEVGMSVFLVSKGFTISAYMSPDGAKSEFSPYYSHVKEHLQAGIPLIKKKILFSSYRRDEFATLARMNFDIDPSFYIKLIKARHKTTLLSFEKLYEGEFKNPISFFERLKYNLLRKFIQLYRKLRYGR